MFLHAKPGENVFAVLPWITHVSQNGGMSTPGIWTEFLQVRTQPCPEWIQMNVPNQFLEIRVLVADNRLVSVFKQMTVPLVPSVESYRVSRQKSPHESGKACRTASHQQVDMVWKQSPSIDTRSCERCHVPEPGNEGLPILVIAHDQTLLCPADDDVMQSAWGV
jgi:hypothetical protein